VAIVTAGATTVYDVAPHRLSLNPAPKLIGSARVGTKLRVLPNSWSSQPDTVSYRWMDCWGDDYLANRVPGVYAVPKKTKGCRVRVTVTATKSGLWDYTKNLYSAVVH
jgi:hypothetical protein